MSLPTLEQFEAAAIDPGNFDHEAHVYVGWRYLQRADLLDAIGRYRAGLRRLVRRVGAEDKYHETITWFYMVSIAERLDSAPAGDWDAFKRANPELFERRPGWLERHYSPGRLASPQARRRFVLPDRAP